MSGSALARFLPGPLALVPAALDRPGAIRRMREEWRSHERHPARPTSNFRFTLRSPRPLSADEVYARCSQKSRNGLPASARVAPGWQQRWQRDPPRQAEIPSTMRRTNKPRKQEHLRPTEIGRDRQERLKIRCPPGGVRVRVPPPALGKWPLTRPFLIESVVTTGAKTKSVAANVGSECSIPGGWRTKPSPASRETGDSTVAIALSSAQVHGQRNHPQKLLRASTPSSTSGLTFISYPCARVLKAGGVIGMTTPGLRSDPTSERFQPRSGLCSGTGSRLGTPQTGGVATGS